jgi:hypothetical protein
MMPFVIEKVGAQLAAAMIAALKTDSSKVVALATAEGHKLAYSLARIADMLAQQQIDSDEAQMLARVQKDASEAVLASLAEVSRVAARRAVNIALGGVAGIVDSAAGFPILATLLHVVAIKG